MKGLRTLIVRSGLGDLAAAAELVTRVYGEEWSVGFDGTGYQARLQNFPSYFGKDRTPTRALLRALKVYLEGRLNAR